MSPQAFIAQISGPARASMALTNIPASFTVAEAALESGWGSASPGNNLFGIKADPSWTGPTVSVPTHEFVNGQMVTITAVFRAYPDWLASIEDHATFLTANPRYAPAFAYTCGINFAQAVAAAGYATDPNYAAKIIAIIKAHNLSALDIG